MARGTRTVYSGKRNAELSSTFQPPEEGRSVQRPKCCDKDGDKDGDTRPKNVNHVYVCLFFVLEIQFQKSQIKFNLLWVEMIYCLKEFYFLFSKLINVVNKSQFLSAKKLKVDYLRNIRWINPFINFIFDSHFHFLKFLFSMYLYVKTQIKKNILFSNGIRSYSIGNFVFLGIHIYILFSEFYILHLTFIPRLRNSFGTKLYKEYHISNIELTSLGFLFSLSHYLFISLSL